MVLQSAALIARNKGVVRRLNPSLKRLYSYLCDTLRHFKRAAGASSPLVSELLFHLSIESSEVFVFASERQYEGLWIASHLGL
jgi:hypothetical protein